jgi:hypothetical protein
MEKSWKTRNHGKGHEKSWNFGGHGKGHGILEVMEKVMEFLNFDHLYFLLHHKILHFINTVHNFGIQFWVDRIFRISGSSDPAQ